MARQLKCPRCGTLNDKENTVKDNGRYYCPHCHEEKLKDDALRKLTKSYKKCDKCGKEFKKDDMVQVGSKYRCESCQKIQEKINDDRSELYDYICQLYETDVLHPLILKQMEEYKTQRKYKYKGMLLALRYFYETLGNTTENSKGIGIIPWVYEDAKQNYINMKNANKSLNEIEGDLVEEQIVAIEVPQTIDFEKMELINIDEL